MDHEEVLNRCRNLAVAGLWPHLRLMAPDAWLQNFLTEERDYAVAALGAVVFFQSEATNTLLEAAIRQLAPTVTDSTESYQDRRAQWINFLLNVKVIYPDPHNGNPSKSGPLFVRKSRQLFGWLDEQMLDHDAIVDAVHADPTLPVLFVDDFAGTGHQFLESWRRERPLKSGGTTNFADLASKGLGHYYFCPAIANFAAQEAIASAAPTVTMSAAHYLTPEMSLRSSEPLLLPREMRSGFREFVEAASLRAEIPLDEVWGYGKQGLSLGFEHGVPDATLGLLTWEGEGWTPLMKRL